MRKPLIWNLLKVSPAIIAATFLNANSALANEVSEQVTTVAELSEETGSMGQVTSVSQFSDVLCCELLAWLISVDCKLFVLCDCVVTLFTQLLCLSPTLFVFSFLLMVVTRTFLFFFFF